MSFDAIVTILGAVLLPISGAALRELMRIRERLSELNKSDETFKDTISGMWKEIKTLRKDVNEHGKQIYYLEKKHEQNYTAH